MVDKKLNQNTKQAWSEWKRTGISFHAIFQEEKYRRCFA